jgi:hypothetical protein
MATVALAPGETAADPAEAAGPYIESIHLGIANHYKVGSWTQVLVQVDGRAPLKEPQIQVVVPDSDGVETSNTLPLPDPIVPDGSRTAAVYTRVGYVGAPVRVRLMEGERIVDEQTVRPGAGSHSGSPTELPPSAELTAVCGASAADVQSLLAQGTESAGASAHTVVAVEEFANLPDRWFGYEALDLLIILVDDSSRWRELAESKRFDALVRWIELGGRLVIVCGGENADELLADGKPLAPLLPAKFAEVVRLPETGRLEHYANTETAVAGGRARTSIMVPRLIDVQGKIELYAGQQATALPLVVRAPRGFGEVAFVGVDLMKPPLADWPGRPAFLRALLQPYLGDVDSQTAPTTLVARGYNDLSGALRQRLGRSFAGVAPITFPVVTVLALAYLVVLGPLDYLVVHRWLRRPRAAWITFPLMVVLFSGAALAIAAWRGGSGGPRINELELVDVDVATGQARGTFWSTLYSPRAQQFDLELRLDATLLADQAAPRSEILLSWWGLPGSGIGGMQARRTELGVGEGLYRYGPHLSTLENVPVLTASTKSFAARWTAPAAPLIEAHLADEGGLVVGSINNRTGRLLRNIRLLYNGWAYRLGNLRDGRIINVGDQFVPRRVKTVVAQDALGAAAPALSEGAVFNAEQATTDELLKLMMSYEAAGGLGFAGLPSHYQAYCDLSRQLDVGRAILVADVQTPGSRLASSDSGLPLGNEQDSATVVYRFLLPVSKSE